MDFRISLLLQYWTFDKAHILYNTMNIIYTRRS
jgi:hypothetical protein